MRTVRGLEAARKALERPLLYYGSELEPAVRNIIDDVRARGDAALREYTRKFDGAEIRTFEVSPKAVRSARAGLSSDLLSAMEFAAERIRDFHAAQKRRIYSRLTRSGAGQIMRPLERVGVYAPGGTASYPSTVFMTAIPAQTAGVSEIILATPPGRDGVVPAVTLAAAAMAGVSRVFSVGGAQAVAALAFGTDSVPRVDKICGPGNIYVALAKKLVYGAVDIDGLQGPSEVLLIGDDTARPEYCAADLLAQAEHDRQASAVMVTDSARLAREVELEIERQLAGLPRREFAAESLRERGIIAVVADIDEAVELANVYAPEHLILLVSNPEKYLDRLTNAGCIFSGESATVAIGDYVAGPSHVLPTGGSARFSSPLNVLDFIKLTSTIEVSGASLRRLGGAAVTMARAEGLEAHARAVELRLKGREGRRRG